MTAPNVLTPETGSGSTGILVVDDDPVVLSLLQLCLTRAGFSVWTALGGRAALAAYPNLREQIDLVLVDVRMPAPDGPETLRELRRLDPGVPCCFMSGHTGDYEPDMLLQMGALRVFDKPFNLDELTQTLHHLVGATRLKRTA